MHKFKQDNNIPPGSNYQSAFRQAKILEDTWNGIGWCSRLSGNQLVSLWDVPPLNRRRLNGRWNPTQVQLPTSILTPASQTASFIPKPIGDSGWDCLGSDYSVPSYTGLASWSSSVPGWHDSVSFSGQFDEIPGQFSVGESHCSPAQLGGYGGFDDSPMFPVPAESFDGLGGDGFLFGEPRNGVDGSDFQFNDLTIPIPALDTSNILSAPAVASNPVPPINTLANFACSYLPCTKSFKRDYERIRHERSVHLHTAGLYLCPIVGCGKSTGRGWKRGDKVTEHLWKAHANLGYVRRA